MSGSSLGWVGILGSFVKAGAIRSKTAGTYQGTQVGRPEVVSLGTYAYVKT